MPTLATIIQHSTRTPATAIRKQKGIKGTQIDKEDVKTSLFADDMILCMENPKESTPKLLEVIEQFSNSKINLSIQNQCSEISCISVHEQ